MKSKVLLFLATATMLFSCKKDEDKDNSRQILVGVGITGLSIGDKAQVAIDLWGEGFKSYTSFGSQYTHFLTYFSEGVDVYCETTNSETFDPQAKIAYITLNSPFVGKTDKGIGIGSTKDEVVAAYGQPTTSDSFFGDEYDNGLTINYDDAGTKVEQITVDKP